jgi:hypothetical protein
MATLLGMLPLPRFATRPWFFALLAAVHVYLGGGHLLELVQHPVAWTDIWKGFGAIFGAYYFVALAARQRRNVPADVPARRDPQALAARLDRQTS